MGCGDNIREGTEACDGTDDLACPHRCAADCTCGPITCPTIRMTQDQPDDQGGEQIHAIYVLPSDGTDELLDTMDEICTSVLAWNKWLLGQTGTNNFRLDTAGGVLDITFFQSSMTDYQIRNSGQTVTGGKHPQVRDTIQNELFAAGVIEDPFAAYGAKTKLYAVYYGGTSDFACGGGALPPGLMGNVAALYLKGDPGCSFVTVGGSIDNPGYFEFAMIHEIMHTIGLVPFCAPHQVLGGHVPEPNDLMYGFDGVHAWILPPVLDIGHDDYYRGDGQPCTDLARSAFLDPPVPNADLPPGWGTPIGSSAPGQASLTRSQDLRTGLLENALPSPSTVVVLPAGVK